MPILVSPANADNATVTTAFEIGQLDKVYLSPTLVTTGARLQRRSTDGADDWIPVTPPGIQTSLTEDVLLYDASTATVNLGAGQLFRVAFGVAVTGRVKIEHAYSEVTPVDSSPAVAPDSIFSFTPESFIQNQKSLALLPAGSIVLAYLSGQSNWQGIQGRNFTGTWPAKSKFWDGINFDNVIDSANGYRVNDNPTIHLALRFEQEYPDLELWVVEDGRGDSGFNNDRFDKFLADRVIERFDRARRFTEQLPQPVYNWFFCFNQGEADEGTEEDGVSYFYDLSRFVQRVKQTIGTEVPYAQVRTNINLRATSDPDNPNRARVRKAQEELAQILINVDDIDLDPADDVHYLDYAPLGNRLFDTLFNIQLTPQPKAEYKAPLPRSWNFVDIDVMPAEWKLNIPSATFGASFTRFPVAGGTDINWIESPELNMDDYDVLATYRSVPDSHYYGLSSDYEDVTFGNTLGYSVAVDVGTDGTIFYRGVDSNRDVELAQYARSREHTLRFNKNGDQIRITCTDSTDGTSNTAVVNDYKLPNPRLFIDGNLALPAIVSIAEVPKA